MNSKKEFNGSPTALANLVRVTRSRPKGPGESRAVWNSSVVDWLAALNGSKDLSGGADRLADGSQEMADSIDSVVLRSSPS